MVQNLLAMETRYGHAYSASVRVGVAISEHAPNSSSTDTVRILQRSRDWLK